MRYSKKIESKCIGNLLCFAGNHIPDVKRMSVDLENFLWRRELPVHDSDRKAISKHFEDLFRSRGKFNCNDT